MGGMQLCFTSHELTTAKKKPEREKFLSDVEVVVPACAGRFDEPPNPMNQEGELPT